MIQIARAVPKSHKETDNTRRCTDRSYPTGDPASSPVGPTELAMILDLRRRQPRPVVETVLTLSVHLPTGERALVEAVFAEGRAITDLARCAGLRPREMCRRLRRALVRRIDPRFAVVAAMARTWAPRRRLVGTLHILHGRTIRDSARRLGLTQHAVRRELGAIDALFTHHRADPPTGRPTPALTQAGR